MKNEIKCDVVVDLDNDNYNDYNCSRDELSSAYEALDRLNSGVPASWNGVGWNGDNRNQFGKDKVREAIWASLDELEELEELED